LNDFVTFCRGLGIVLDTLPPIGRWVRVPTKSHPHKKNGAVKFLGSHGFAQEHSTMQEVAVWRAEEGTSAPVIDMAALRAATAREHLRIEQARAKAAARAAQIMGATRHDRHPYLLAKGFGEDATGLVWDRDGERVLVVPMRVGTRLVGCQLIGPTGDKKFLSGQLTRGAVFVLGQGDPIYCEGYATGLSAHAAAQAARVRASVVICFSAHNMQVMATAGIVLADNDASGTGERAAQASGRPYWMSPIVGEDFNDYAKRAGPFAASQAIKRTWMDARRRSPDKEPPVT